VETLGAFADDAPAGELAVDVSAAGFREAFVTGVVVEELRTRKGIEVRLDPGVTLKGRVVDAASGQPVAEAVVQAESAESVTDADGLFSLRGVPSGKVFVHGEYWDAVSLKPAAVGASIRVTAIDKLKLTVEPVPHQEGV